MDDETRIALTLLDRRNEMRISAIMSQLFMMRGLSVEEAADGSKVISDMVDKSYPLNLGG